LTGYLIINTGYVERLLKEDRIKRIQDELEEYEGKLIALTVRDYDPFNHNPRIIYGNNAIISRLIDAKIPAINLFGCVIIEGPVQLTSAEDILSDLQYCYGIGHPYEISTFEFEGMKFLYADEDTESG